MAAIRLTPASASASSMIALAFFLNTVFNEVMRSSESSLARAFSRSSCPVYAEVASALQAIAVLVSLTHEGAGTVPCALH